MARVYADVNQNMPRSYWDYDSVNISAEILPLNPIPRPREEGFGTNHWAFHRLGGSRELRGRSQDRYVSRHRSFMRQLGSLGRYACWASGTRG